MIEFCIRKINSAIDCQDSYVQLKAIFDGMKAIGNEIPFFQESMN